MDGWDLNSCPIAWAVSYPMEKRRTIFLPRHESSQNFVSVRWRWQTNYFHGSKIKYKNVCLYILYKKIILYFKMELILINITIFNDFVECIYKKSQHSQNDI